MNKHRIFNYFLGLTVLLTSACSNDDLAEKGELDWQTEYPTNVLASSMPPAIFGDIVIYSNNFIVGTDFLIAYNKTNGKEIWRNEDPIYLNAGGSMESYVEGDRVYLFSYGIISCLDINGEIQWSNKVFNSGGGANMLIDGDIMLLEGEIEKEAYIIRIDKENGFAEHIFHYPKIDKGSRVSGMTIMEANNRKYLMTELYYSAEVSSEGFDSLFVYNWPELDLIKTSDFLPLTVSNGLNSKDGDLIVRTDHAFHRYDVFQDSVLWNYDNQRPHMWSIGFHNNAIYYADALLLGNNVKDFIKISGETGQELWRIPINYPLDRVTYYGDYFYLEYKGVYQKRSTATGEVVHEFYNPEDKDRTGGSFDIAITIDPVTQDIYTADYSSALKYRNVD